jgi:outer membrane protein OmpA-like peptidoglycan-associated protein
LAFVIPRLIRFYASGETLPDQPPSGVEEFLAQGQTDRLVPRSRGIRRPKGKKKTRVRSGGLVSGKVFWRGGVLVLLVSGYFLGQEIYTRTQQASPSTNHNDEALALAPAELSSSPEMPQAENKGPGSKLVLRSYGHQMEYLGLVSRPELRKEIIEKLQKFYGPTKISGEIVIDSERTDPLWVTQMDRLLPLLNVPGLDVRLEGNAIRVGGWLSEEDRNSVLSSLMSALGSSFRYGYLREEETERSQDSRQLLLAGLNQVTPDTKVQDLVALLNRWILVFPEGGSAFPEDSRDLATRIASVLGSLKSQAVIEIQGHVADQANATQSIRLSLDRANAVRDALIKAGLSQNLLRTKGYGSDRKTVNAEGQGDDARNERIEFRVIQVCDPYFPCGATPVKRVPQPDPNLPDASVEPSVAPPVIRPTPTTESPVKSIAAPMTGGSATAESSKLKALSEEAPVVSKPRPKPPEAQKPPAPKNPEWYDPLGLF